MTISAPLEVLCRYAEILKIRLPIRKFSAEMLHSESAEGANMLEFKLSNIDGSAFEHSMMGIPLFSDVHDELKSWFEKLQEPFYPDGKVFQRRGHQHTAIYSRYENCWQFVINFHTKQWCNIEELNSENFISLQ